MTLSEYFKDWLKVIDISELSKVVNILNTLYQKKSITPNYTDIFKAFILCTLHKCKIIFIGQDPYPQKGIATGLAFGNSKNTKILSPSLEVLKDSILDKSNHPSLISFDFDVSLEDWAKQGILLLNSALTCEVNQIGSHTMLWRPFISKLLQNLSKEETGLIYVLLGSQAQSFEPYINSKTNYILKEKHPSYYARTNTPMPNTIFKEINNIIMNSYGIPIKWYTEL